MINKKNKIILKGEEQNYLLIRGNMHKFKINNNLIINISDLKFTKKELNNQLPYYFKTYTIEFKEFSFLNLLLTGWINESNIIIGEREANDRILKYSGTCGIDNIAKKYPTKFHLEIVCKKIEIFYTHNFPILTRLKKYYKEILS